MCTVALWQTDNDMSIVYFLLKIHDQKKMIMSQKSKTIGEIVKSQLKEEQVIENIVMGQTIIEEDTSMDIIMIIKLNLNINVKIVIQNMYGGAFVNGWVPNLANLSEIRTLCQFDSTDRPYVFNDLLNFCPDRP